MLLPNVSGTYAIHDRKNLPQKDGRNREIRYVVPTIDLIPFTDEMDADNCPRIPESRENYSYRDSFLIFIQEIPTASFTANLDCFEKQFSGLRVFTSPIFDRLRKKTL